MNILVPISLGELYDRISILEIKLKNITNTDQQTNISNELKKLLNLDKVKIEDSLYNSLKKVNSELWIIEDKLREKEKNKEFDGDFIELARLVYFTNDNRSRIKREINLTYNSEIIEEKSYKQYS